MNIEKKWLIVSILGVALLFITLFSPFIAYRIDDYRESHHEFVYYNGDWKIVDTNQTGTTTTEGNYQDWDDNFSLASPILLLLGISIMIIGSLALIFEINTLWGLLFRSITLLGSILGFIGIMIYVPFAIYVVHIDHITFSVTFL